MNEIRLKTLMRTLTEAAAYANGLLRGDYANALRETNGFAQPLQISRMRVSFAARAEADESGGDILLNFGDPDGNFKGEIIFRPFDPEAAEDCETGGDMPDIPDGGVRLENTQSIPAYESSQNYTIN